MLTLPSETEAAPRPHARWVSVVAIALFLLIYATTVQEWTGDTPEYAADVAAYIRSGAPTPLWDCGHLLWRPLAYGLWLLGHRWFSLSWSFGRPVNEIQALLFGVNFFAGLALSVLAVAICRRLGVDHWKSLAVASGVLICNPVLNYMHSGTSYIPGLTMSLAGAWLTLKSVQIPARAARYAALSGVALALACGLWLPYALCIPVVLVAGWYASGSGANPPSVPARLRPLGVALATIIVVGIALLVVGIVANKISSVSGLVHWAVSSGHGHRMERGIVRFPAGFARGFIYMADEGLTLKRFVFHDPYVRVRWTDVLPGIWKVAMVFGALGGLMLALARRRQGWPALTIVIVGLIPMLIFAIVVFETSSSERYLPFYVALIFAISTVLRDMSPWQATRWGLLAVALIVAGVDLKAYAWDTRTLWNSAALRDQLVREHADSRNDVTLLLSLRDPLSMYPAAVPFAPANREGPVPIFAVIWPGNPSVATWRADASCRILRAWKQGGTAWLSTRLLAARPEPDWDWVESDDKRVHWVDLPSFFTKLEVDNPIGTQDGFVRVSRTESNTGYLENFCRTLPAGAAPPAP